MASPPLLLCHTFKATSPSSVRVAIGAHIVEGQKHEMRAVLSTGEQATWVSRRKNRGHDRKLRWRIQRVDPAVTHVIPKEDIETLDVMFDQDVCFGEKQMTVVDKNHYSRAEYIVDSNDDLICFIHSAKECIRAFGKQCGRLCDTLKQVQRTAPNVKRSDAAFKSKTTGTYACIGHKASRNHQGIELSKFAKEKGVTYDNLVKMASYSEHLFCQELPFCFRRALYDAQTVVPWNTLTTGASSEESPCFFATLATAINYSSKTHKDKDFFLSSLQIHCLEDVDHNGAYKTDLPVAQHFVFAEYGFAVALRSGDCIIFNPQHFHCSSEKTDRYKDKDVFLTAFYIKSLVVGGNNNDLPLKKIQKQMYEEMKKEKNLQGEKQRKKAKC
jgi:hypothetical protein